MKHHEELLPTVFKHSPKQYMELLKELFKTYLASESFSTGNQRQRSEEVEILYEILKMVTTCLKKNHEGYRTNTYSIVTDRLIKFIYDCEEKLST